MVGGKGWKAFDLPPRIKDCYPVDCVCGGRAAEAILRLDAVENSESAEGGL
jgi:hypothetical protein